MALRTLTIDLQRGHARQLLPATVERDYLGGRGAIAWLLWNHLPPGTPPLAPENLLIFAAGPLAGLDGYANGGFVVGTRSPLTGAIGYGWAQGHWGAALRRAGYDVLVIRGQAPEWVYLYLDGETVRLRSAAALVGLDTVATSAALRTELGDEVLVACLGPAGEHGVAYSSIVAEGRYLAEPAGSGLVMANKRLKAIVVRPAPGPLPAHDSRRLAAALEVIQRRVEHSPLAARISSLGSSHLLARATALGALTGHNGRSGSLSASLVDSRDALATLGGRQSRGCHGCPMPCYFDVVGPQGRPAPLPDLETVAGFGARCGISSPDALVAIAERCLHLGLDPSAASATIAFLMECQAEGLNQSATLPWGDASAVLSALERLAVPQQRRDMLSLGVGEIADVFWGGAAFAPQVKGLAMPALDPRALPGIALAVATAPIGGDYRYSMAYEELVPEPPAWLPEAGEPQSLRARALRLIWHERFAATLDAVGLCRRLGLMAYQVSPGELLALIGAATGASITAADMARLGERIVTVERLFACRYADNGCHDDLPARWQATPLAEGPAAGQLPPLAELRAEYYRRHGWNAAGEPTPERLAELGVRG